MGLFFSKKEQPKAPEKPKDVYSNVFLAHYHVTNYNHHLVITKDAVSKLGLKEGQKIALKMRLPLTEAEDNK